MAISHVVYWILYKRVGRNPAQVEVSVAWHVVELQDCLFQAHQLVRESLAHAQDQQKTH